jgi:hypothetical protein
VGGGERLARDDRGGEDLAQLARRDPQLFHLAETFGFTEGKNNKTKLIKRQGYGYGNFDNF